MYKPVILARSKLKNFAPKILLYAERGVLSIRNANIVFGGTAKQEFISESICYIRQGFNKNLYPHAFCWHSDAGASLCQQKEKQKNTRLQKGNVKTKKIARKGTLQAAVTYWVSCCNAAGRNARGSYSLLCQSLTLVQILTFDSHLHVIIMYVLLCTN